MRDRGDRVSADDGSDSGDSGDESSDEEAEVTPSRTYVLQELLTYLSSELRADIVREWPLPKDAVLKEWIAKGGDVGAMADLKAAEMRHFLNDWCYSFPSSTQRIERCVKRTSVLVRNKAAQRAALTQHLHMSASLRIPRRVGWFC